MQRCRHRLVAGGIDGLCDGGGGGGGSFDFRGVGFGDGVDAKDSFFSALGVLLAARCESYGSISVSYGTVP